MVTRALTLGMLGALALVAIGAWGVVKIAEGDWFIGGAFVVCALLGARSLFSTVRRMRHG